MKKKIYMLIMCMLTVSVLFGCGNDETQEQQADQGTYFKIVDEINNGNYETAFSDIEKNYGNVDYKDPSDGMNKMLLYRLYYDTQEMFDDEMGVLLDYLKAVDFKAILAEDGISQENISRYSSNIVLTYIPDPELFIFRFALFVSELVPEFCDNSRLATILKYAACSNSKVSS